MQHLLDFTQFTAKVCIITLQYAVFLHVILLQARVVQLHGKASRRNRHLLLLRLLRMLEAVSYRLHLALVFPC